MWPPGATSIHWAARDGVGTPPVANGSTPVLRLTACTPVFSTRRNHNRKTPSQLLAVIRTVRSEIKAWSLQIGKFFLPISAVGQHAVIAARGRKGVRP